MKKVCKILREEELGAILEKLRVIREFEWQAEEGYAADDNEFWELIGSCRDLLGCLLIIDDDKRREVVSIKHGRKEENQ